MIRTVDNKTHPGLHALDLLSAQRSGGRIHATVANQVGTWKVLAVTVSGDSRGGDYTWSARVEMSDEPDPPRGPLTEPRRRRG